jgi:hypothetical protein
MVHDNKAEDSWMSNDLERESFHPRNPAALPRERKKRKRERERARARKREMHRERERSYR